MGGFRDLYTSTKPPSPSELADSTIYPLCFPTSKPTKTTLPATERNDQTRLSRAVAHGPP